MIIGLSGYARSGKDTAAKGLELFGFRRVAFADKLRDFLLALNPIVDIQSVPGRAFGGPDERHEVRVSDVIETYGWDGYKNSVYGTEVRALLQRLGTECGRELISDTIWIDAALGKPSPNKGVNNLDSIVVTDVRFPNEAQAIKDRGGYVVRIEREGVGPANDHPSEHALADWLFDAIIQNDGTVNELSDKLANTALYFAL